MTARKRKSKKRSAANLKPPENPVFFIDEALGGHQIPAALRAAGENVETHNDVFPSGTPDVEWLEYAGRNKRLVITKDKRIRYRRIEIITIRKYEVKVFRFASGNLSGKQMAEILVKAKDKIKKYARNHKDPFIVSVTKDGKLNPVDI